MARAKKVKLPAFDVSFFGSYGKKQCRTAGKAIRRALTEFSRNPDRDVSVIMDDVHAEVGDDVDDLMKIIEQIIRAIQEAKEE